MLEPQKFVKIVIKRQEDRTIASPRKKKFKGRRKQEPAFDALAFLHSAGVARRVALF
jgi:hypothetical protein